MTSYQACWFLAHIWYQVCVGNEIHITAVGARGYRLRPVEVLNLAAVPVSCGAAWVWFALALHSKELSKLYAHKAASFLIDICVPFLTFFVMLLMTPGNLYVTKSRVMLF